MTGIESTPKLEKYVETKLNAVHRLIPKSAAVVYDVELARATKHHKSGKIFKASVNIAYDGTMYRAAESSETIEGAIDMVKDELWSEISKKRGKELVKKRKGSRAIKEMAKGAGPKKKR